MIMAIVMVILRSCKARVEVLFPPGWRCAGRFPIKRYPLNPRVFSFCKSFRCYGKQSGLDTYAVSMPPHAPPSFLAPLVESVLAGPPARTPPTATSALSINSADAGLFRACLGRGWWAQKSFLIFIREWNIQTKLRVVAYAGKE